MPRTHRLKTWPEYFNAVRFGAKTFEVRKDDRGGFNLGDALALEEWDPVAQEYTGSQTVRYVSYVVRGGQHGIEPGYVVLGLGKVP